MATVEPSEITVLRNKNNIKGLIKALRKGKSNDVRLHAAKALGDKGDLKAVEPLMAALEDKDWVVRFAAAQALGNIGDKQAVEPLTKALEDTDSQVRHWAAHSLGKIGDARAVEALMAALEDKEWVVREPVAVALRNIGDLRAVEPLIKAIDDRWISVRSVSIQALGEMGDVRSTYCVWWSQMDTPIVTCGITVPGQRETARFRDDMPLPGSWNAENSGQPCQKGWIIDRISAFEEAYGECR
jgi:HEAT repeat protein